MKEKRFLWGVTNIGSQTEGYCTTSNWAVWERRALVPMCGRGNDYWNDWETHHNLLTDLGVNSFRLTIEWSRIEPQEGQFDLRAIDRYREILLDLKTRDIIVVVGLWHWSIPAWVESDYGMHHTSIPELFSNFAVYVRDAIGHLIDIVVVLNEPMVYVGTGYLQGSRPPFYKKDIRFFSVARNLIRMHNQTYDLWKEKYPGTSVGSTHLINDIAWHKRSVAGKIFNAVTAFFRYSCILKKTIAKSDYIGVNYYTSDKFFFGRSGGRWGFHGANDWHSPDVWRHFPEGLSAVLKSLTKYKKPLYILENGKPTNPGVDDYDRQEFLQQTIETIQKSKKDGVDVCGYFHYNFCDSYEWDSGFDFKFGLVEVDRESLKMTKRESFDVYKKIIQNDA